MGNKHRSKREIPRTSRELLQLTNEKTAALSRSLAQKAIDSLEFTSDAIKRYTPGSLIELTYSRIPFADPATFARLIKRQIDYYTTITEGREITPFERIADSEITLTLVNGMDVSVRPPKQDELESLRSLYTEGLTAEDREARFFREVSAERAAIEGTGCSSLVMPEDAIDLVAVTSGGDIIAHSGYAAEDSDASVHISVHKDWRMRIDNGERLSTVMFSRTLAMALLDPRVNRISAETLRSNDKINRLVTDTMHPKGAKRHEGDGFDTTTITKMLDAE